MVFICLRKEKVFGCFMSSLLACNRGAGVGRSYIHTEVIFFGGIYITLQRAEQHTLGDAYQ